MKQVAVGVLFNGEHVLACQRKRDARYPLKWEFPGGKVEIGESPEAAVVRELREELEINVAIGAEFHRQEWVYSDDGSDWKSDGKYRVSYFLVHSFSGTMVNHAFEQTRWVTLEELRGMDILEGNRKAVEILICHAREKQNAE
jgi:8-oxo-dGTP diphosphatase